MKSNKGSIHFEGSWENDKPNGYGITKFGLNGDRHEGNYKNGLRHGLGIFLWANGDRFTGNFEQGIIHCISFVLSRNMLNRRNPWCWKAKILQWR